jgi:pyruvate/2-oxoglutarate/acetoin dehydrogenase E1 component
MTYVESVNAYIRERMARTQRLVAFGQNITAGSCLSGLTRGITTGPGGLLLNTPNVENTLVGAGMGVMLRGLDAIFFCKQQDFLLLGIDHMVNTYNALRHRDDLGSFTIVAIVVDSGFEGPQSRLNNLSDFCSLANVPGFAISGDFDARAIVERHLVAPGFRLIAVSQRLFRTEIATFGTGQAADLGDAGVIRYARGGDATVVGFNLAMPQADEAWRAVGASGRTSSLFGVHDAWIPDWASAVEDAVRSGRLIVLDDARSVNRQSDRFVNAVRARRPDTLVVHPARAFCVEDLRPHADAFALDVPGLLRALDGADRARALAIPLAPLTGR